MNKKIISALIIWATLTAWSAFAATNTLGSTSPLDTKSWIVSSSESSTFSKDMWMKKRWMWERKNEKESSGCKMMWWMMWNKWLWEKSQVTDSKRLLRETVIDKLLSWETLTTEEETVRTEMIKERADMKAKKAEMEAIKVIFNKQKAWTTLTSDEQAKLDAFKASMPNRR